MNMKKASNLLVATIIVVLLVTLISTGWIFIPALVLNSESSYLANQALFFSFWAALVAGIIVSVIGVAVYLALDYKGQASQTNRGLAGFVKPWVIVLVIIFLTSTEGSASYSSG